MMCSLIATISPFRRSISAQRRAFSSSAVAISRLLRAGRVRPVRMRSDGTPWPLGGNKHGRPGASSSKASAAEPWSGTLGRAVTRPRARRPMAQRRFPVLVATDGSPAARAAVEAAIVFPWPPGSTGHGVVARRTPVLTDATPAVWDALLEVGPGRGSPRGAATSAGAGRTRRSWSPTRRRSRESSRGPESSAREAIVLGSRGLGAVGRLLLGSVSRAVVRQAPCAVLVVRGSARAPAPVPGRRRRLPHARDAVAFVAGLEPPRGGTERTCSASSSRSGSPPPGSCPLACAPW